MLTVFHRTKREAAEHQLRGVFLRTDFEMQTQSTNQIFQKQSNLEDEFNMARLANEKDAADAIGLDLATFRFWLSSGKIARADCGLWEI
jgi:hypothetical protein